MRSKWPILPSRNFLGMALLGVLFLFSKGLLAGGSKSPDSEKEVIPGNWMTVKIEDASLTQLRQSVEALIASETPSVGDCNFEKVEAMQEVVQGASEVVETKGLQITTVRNFRHRSEVRTFELPQYNNHAFSLMNSVDDSLEYWSANYFVYESVANESHPEVREHKWLFSIRAEDRRIVELSYQIFKGLERDKKIEEVQCIEGVN